MKRKNLHQNHNPIDNNFDHVFCAMHTQFIIFYCCHFGVVCGGCIATVASHSIARQILRMAEKKHKYIFACLKGNSLLTLTSAQHELPRSSFYDYTKKGKTARWQAAAPHTHTNRKIIVYSQLTSLQEIVSHLTNFPQLIRCVCCVCLYAIFSLSVDDESSVQFNHTVLRCAVNELIGEYTCNMSAHSWVRYSQRLQSITVISTSWSRMAHYAKIARRRTLFPFVKSSVFFGVWNRLRSIKIWRKNMRFVQYRNCAFCHAK